MGASHELRDVSLMDGRRNDPGHRYRRLVVVLLVVVIVKLVRS
jgi:hypothetical protein